MSLYRITGVILNRRDVGSVDRRVTVLTGDGKHELRARGTQKLESKLAGSLEPLTLVELTVAHGRAVDQVTGSTIRNAYRKIHVSIARLAGAGLVAAASDAVIRGRTDDPRPYRRVRESLALLEASKTNRDVLLAVAYGLWSLIGALGHAPLPTAPTTPEARLRAVLLRGDAKLVRRIRCTVPTARRCVGRAVDDLERIAERAVPAARFFQRATVVVH